MKRNRIIAVKGGLGNQMFQYAVYRELEENGFNCFLDISPYKNYSLHNGFEIPNIFDIQSIQYGGFEKINPLAKIPKLYRFVNHRIIEDKHLLIDRFDFKQGKGMFESSRDLNLDGYWQSEKYFLNVKEQLRKEFVFKVIGDKNLDYAKQLDHTQSISLHVRRGDYLNNPLFPEGCTSEYYQNAIQFFQRKFSSPLFIIISDDIAWCKDEFVGSRGDFEFVDWNRGPMSYQDMYLMSRCKHNIIANSSFSWWGAWLNPNSDKIIIAPKKWFYDNNPFNDIVPPSWIKQ